MNWSSVQMNAAVIAGLVSLSISLIVALVAAILAVRRARHNFRLEFAAEGVAREMLTDCKSPYRAFRVLKYHLSGFTDDELRKILVRAGGIRLTAGGQEVWGLLTRNREYLSVEEIKEPPATQIVFNASDQEENQQQRQQEEDDIEPQDQLDLSRDTRAIERVRAEMIKLGTLGGVIDRRRGSTKDALRRHRRRLLRNGWPLSSTGSIAFFSTQAWWTGLCSRARPKLFPRAAKVVKLSPLSGAAKGRSSRRLNIAAARRMGGTRTNDGQK